MTPRRHTLIVGIAGRFFAIFIVTIPGLVIKTALARRIALSFVKWLGIPGTVSAERGFQAKKLRHHSRSIYLTWRVRRLSTIVALASPAESSVNFGVVFPC